MGVRGLLIGAVMKLLSGPWPALCARASGAGASASPATTNYFGMDDPSGITAGPDGALWFTSANNGLIGRVSTAGKIPLYSHRGLLAGDQGIVTGPDGALW